MAVSPALYHTCALDTNGKAFCWGRMGDQAGVITPEAVGTQLRFKMITTGIEHACALTNDGEAYCWGANTYGQLGNLAIGGALRIAPSRVATNHRFKSIDAGALFTCGLTETGFAYCWGSNHGAQLGIANASRCGVDDLECATAPRLAASGQQFKTISIGANGYSVCGITAGGSTMCWGSNHYMQLGVTAVPKPCEIGVLYQCSATPLTVSSPVVFDTISLGSQHGCGLAAGRAYCWGSNTDGELGLPEEWIGERCYSKQDGCFGTAVAVSGNIAFRQVASGGTFTCALGTDDRTYCWGNTYILGDANPTIARTPTRLTADVRFKHLQSGVGTICGITDTSALYCWGINNEGQVGVNHSAMVTLPALVR